MTENETYNQPTFIILGASLDTGNLGVNALLVSSLQCIIRNYADPCVKLLSGIAEPTKQFLEFPDGSVLKISYVKIRWNKEFWRKNNLLYLLILSIFSKFLPEQYREKWLCKNPFLRELITARAVFDITGGDSFSDIYGMRRYLFGSMRKMLILLCGARLILLPQTYGPFQSKFSKKIAKYILRKADRVYSRDQRGMDYLRSILPEELYRKKVKLSPDVAFVLSTKPPKQDILSFHERVKNVQGILIGLNFSGLLYNGGYTQKNMFGLSVDYPKFAESLVRLFLKNSKHHILLIDHVITQPNHVENDPDVSDILQKKIGDEFGDRVYHLSGSFDQFQTKYLIGRCDFFAGSRMHACIAALSQKIPTAGLAYSDKFIGVFSMAGMGGTVVDLRSCSMDQATHKVNELFEDRNTLRVTLEKNIPVLQKQVYEMFTHII